MKICSFDVGIKNLAYCIIDKKDNDFEIIDWNLINISDQEKKEKLTCTYYIGKKKCGKNSKQYYIDNDTKMGLCMEHKIKLSSIISPKYFQTYDKEEESEKSKKSKKSTIICGGGTIKCACKDEPLHTDKEYTKYFCKKHYEKELKTTLKNYKLQKLKNLNVNYESNIVLATNMYERLDKIPEMLEVDSVIIENQPSLKNPVMKNIASLLFGYFVLRGILEKKIKLVKFMSPLNKLKMNKEITENELSKYTKKADIKRATKKLGITYCKILLNKKKKQLEMIEDHKKQDDLCDAFLQGYYYLYKNEGFGLDIDLYNKMTKIKKIKIE